MTKLDVPVKSRLPVSAWAFAALVTLFSLLSSLIASGGTEHGYQASMTQLFDFFRAFQIRACPGRLCIMGAMHG
jgi:hypothetical protein